MRRDWEAKKEWASDTRTPIRLAAGRRKERRSAIREGVFVGVVTLVGVLAALYAAGIL
jgi:hypothetical protein